MHLFYRCLHVKGLLFFFFLLLLAPGISACSSEAPLRGEVIRVTDGDTVVIHPENGGISFTCRLYGIDAPETAKKDRKGQPYAVKAGEELRNLVSGHTVQVVRTGEKTYNREVCIIMINDMDINREMVKRGYAWAYRKHLRSPYASEYIGAEKDARSRGAGIWQQDNPMPPWEFKRRYWKD